MKTWARSCGLEVNAEKTEYIVYNDTSPHMINLDEEHRVAAGHSATYLGYRRLNNDRAIQHLRERIAKAKKASLSTHSYLRGLKYLPV